MTKSLCLFSEFHEKYEIKLCISCFMSSTNTVCIILLATNPFYDENTLLHIVQNILFILKK